MITIRLKEVTKQKGYTLTDISRSTHISMNTLSVLGRGESNGIQFDTLEKICRFLSVTPNDLIEISSDKYVVALDPQKLVGHQAVATVYSESDYKKMASDEGQMVNLDDAEHRIVIAQMNESSDLVQFFVGLPMQRTDEPKHEELLSKNELPAVREWLQGLDDDQKKSICKQSAYLYMQQFSNGNYPDRIFTAMMTENGSSVIYPFWVGSKSGKLVDLHFQDGGPVRPDDLD